MEKGETPRDPLLFERMKLLTGMPQGASFILERKRDPSVEQDQVHSILFSRELSWQEILWDLINTEQLDPWNINITLLTERFLERLEELEEADFFISSKVLYAAALLLRIKSEFLLNRYLKSIDEILFGKKEEKKRELERIELDEEIPTLIPKSPMPRLKRVTLKELIESLNKAISTENRRIKKEIIKKNALRESAISLPKKKMNIRDKIEEIHTRLYGHFDRFPQVRSVRYSDFVGTEREERILSFYPLLQLENQQKVWLHQEAHFEEINIWLRHIFEEHHGDPFAEIKAELEEALPETTSPRP